MEIFFLILIAASFAEGKILEVPENCLVEKKSPCLSKIGDQEEKVSVSDNLFRANKGTLIQWESFSNELRVTLLEGNIHIEKLGQPFKLNQVLISKNNLLIERKENLLNILDLNTFLLSTYTLFSIQANNVLEKSSFLEKLELLEFISHFFISKDSFKVFVKTIESKWETELKLQAAAQTKVLKRSIANSEQVQLAQQIAQGRKKQELKKVREEFFYRTFYR